MTIVRAATLLIAALCAGPLRAEVAKVADGVYRASNSVAAEQGGMLAAIQRSTAERDAVCQIQGRQAEDLEFKSEDLTPAPSVTVIVFRCVDEATTRALAGANAGARRMADAMQRLDSAAVIAGTYAGVFEGAATREAMRATVEEQYTDLRRKKLRMAIGLAEATELGRSGRQWFVFVPFRMTMTQEGSERRVLSSGLFVGISEDRGATWEYLGYQEASLLRYLPGYRGKPAIPKDVPEDRFR